MAIHLLLEKLLIDHLKAIRLAGWQPNYSLDSHILLCNYVGTPKGQPLLGASPWRQKAACPVIAFCLHLFVVPIANAKHLQRPLGNYLIAARKSASPAFSC